MLPVLKRLCVGTPSFQNRNMTNNICKRHKRRRRLPRRITLVVLYLLYECTIIHRMLSNWKQTFLPNARQVFFFIVGKSSSTTRVKSLGYSWSWKRKDCRPAKRLYTSKKTWNSIKMSSLFSELDYSVCSKHFICDDSGSKMI